MYEEEILDFSTKTNEVADGMRTELFYGFVRELAADK